MIDQQHQVLFDIANQFHENVKGDFDRKTTLNTMNQLINYAQKHFSTEEHIAHELKIPDALVAHHQQVHDQLISDIFALNEKIESGQVLAMADVEAFIREWLVLHILIEDQKYKKHLLKPAAIAKKPTAKAHSPETIKYPSKP